VVQTESKPGVFQVLLLATEIWRNPGGIQRYMRMLIDILDVPGDPVVVLTLLDAETDVPSGVVSPFVNCCGGNRWTFCLSALRLARSRRIRTAVVGHVGFLPIAWVLRQLGYIQQYVVVLHGIEAWKPLSWLSRIASRGAAAAVATTHYTVREFRYHNRLENLSCAIIPLGCTIRASQGPSTIAGELRLLTVTRLAAADAYKGIETILRAIRRARELGVNLNLEIVGDGDGRDRLEGIAQALDVQSEVQFRGSLPDLDLQEAFGRSHVFILPSRKEGFGIAFLEAMSSGLPCIGANHGGTPEVITHGESGFLIEYDDVDRLVFLLRALMESPALFSKMSNAARHRAEILGLDAMTKSWRSLLRDLQAREASADDRAAAEALSVEPDRRRAL
jgi:phosphatidylinositol alpha-1,6-mannosyltransferase